MGGTAVWGAVVHGGQRCGGGQQWSPTSLQPGGYPRESLVLIATILLVSLSPFLPGSLTRVTACLPEHGLGLVPVPPMWAHWPSPTFLSDFLLVSRQGGSEVPPAGARAACLLAVGGGCWSVICEAGELNVSPTTSSKLPFSSVLRLLLPLLCAHSPGRRQGVAPGLRQCAHGPARRPAESGP